MKYLFIDAQKALFPLYMLLRVLAVNKSSYYYWNSYGRSNHEARVQAELDLVEQIREVNVMSKESYGAPRMRTELLERGVRALKRRIAEVMRRHRIVGLCGREPSTRTTIPADLRAFPDLVRRVFTAHRPDRLWYGDITYIRVADSFCYLATVIDAYTKQVVGWALADHMRAELVRDALKDAVRRRGGPRKHVIFHTDRGSQYGSDLVYQYCRANRIWQSMGRTGVCWDNAAAESFFATIKRELINRRRWDNQQELHHEVFEWIHNWYNKTRRHTTIGFIAPDQAHRNYSQLAA